MSFGASSAGAPPSSRARFAACTAQINGVRYGVCTLHLRRLSSPSGVGVPACALVRCTSGAARRRALLQPRHKSFDASTRPRTQTVLSSEGRTGLKLCFWPGRARWLGATGGGTSGWPGPTEHLRLLLHLAEALRACLRFRLHDVFSFSPCAPATLRLLLRHSQRTPSRPRVVKQVNSCRQVDTDGAHPAPEESQG